MARTKDPNIKTKHAYAACKKLGKGWEPITPKKACVLIRKLYRELGHAQLVANQLNKRKLVRGHYQGKGSPRWCATNVINTYYGYAEKRLSGRQTSKKKQPAPRTRTRTVATEHGFYVTPKSRQFLKLHPKYTLWSLADIDQYVRQHYNRQIGHDLDWIAQQLNQRKILRPNMLNNDGKFNTNHLSKIVWSINNHTSITKLSPELLGNQAMTSKQTPPTEKRSVLDLIDPQNTKVVGMDVQPDCVVVSIKLPLSAEMFQLINQYLPHG